MTRVLVAGVDTSTQSTKVRITDAATGEQVRFGQAKHPDGTSVNPEFWREAFTKAAEQAGGLDDVAALAVGGQQHGMVILDKQGNVIRDAMLWNDTSSAPPTLMHEFDVPGSTVQWLTTGFMLTNGIMIPITAFLIETFTTRQLFLYAMGIFAE